MKLRNSIVWLVCVLLTACGGGDSQEPEVDPATASPQGYWETYGAEKKTRYQLTVLENGEIWGSEAPEVGFPRPVWGHMSKSGLQINGVLMHYNEKANRFDSRRITGTFHPDKSMEIAFEDGRRSQLKYDDWYKKRADLHALLGTHPGRGAVLGTSAARHKLIHGSMGERFFLSFNGDIEVADNVNFLPGGQIEFASQSDCVPRGIISARASGANVFDVHVTFSGLGCPFREGMSFSGIGIQWQNKSVSIKTLSHDGTLAFTYNGKRDAFPVALIQRKP